MASAHDDVLRSSMWVPRKCRINQVRQVSIAGVGYVLCDFTLICHMDRCRMCSQVQISLPR